MARFYPLYVRRSDGKLEILAKGKRKEINQPTDEQLDQRPNKNGVSDYYREVVLDEQKHLDWRRKLGAMLAREMDWKDKDKSGQLGSETGCMLVAFPEHYRLYEHVKRTEQDGKTVVKNKTHAAAGSDRQDAYLYGHPSGRKKRYRSPADFFPHLLWLCTDESGDPDNCTCKICSPEELETDTIAPKSRIKQEPDFKVAPSPSLKQESGPQIQVPRPTSKPRQILPTPLSPPKTPDQQIDSRYNVFMFRPGELVWFKRGQAWGLGIAVRRWMGPAKQVHYHIQQLSHPYHKHDAPVEKTSHAEMRPWLAWSVPKYTHDGLNHLLEPAKYETADWQGMMTKRYGNGDLEVDGSILAAKSIDSSYTPFSPETSTEPEPGVTETHFNGLFLGAEKVWVGDPVRLQSPSNTDILVIHSIVERQRTSAMNPQQTLQRSIHFTGDIYQLTHVKHEDPNALTLASPSHNPQLPKRLTEDLMYRNFRSITAKRVASYWRLTAAQATVPLNDVKGRWYEASLLLPILNTAQFEDAARKGEIHESTVWMNARGDCVNANRDDPPKPKLPRQNVRKSTRREAFGRAVPAEMEIEDGVEPPPPLLPENVDPALEAMSSQQSTSAMEIDPRFETVDQPSSGNIQVARPGENGGEDDDGGGGGGLEEFMNLDGMEDSQSQIPGFGKQYGSQGESGYF